MADRISSFYGIVFAVFASALLCATSALAQYNSSPAMQSGAGPQPTAHMTAAGGTEPVAAIPDAKQRLASLSVEDSTGLVVGRVAAVQSGQGGRADEVKVALAPPARPGQTVTLRADDLMFDAGKNVVVSRFSASQIAARAGIPSYTPANEAGGG